MKKPYRDLAVVLALLTASQILSVLFNVSYALTLVTGLIFSLYYLFDNDYLDREEALIGASGFFISTGIFSVLKKIFVLDDLCSVAKASDAVSGSANVLSQSEVCRGVFETWISTFGIDPFQNIFFWLTAIAGGLAAVFIYRKYED
jgi:hypothetical protein